MLPKITFGIIVLNGEPFTRYNLRALYPFAHEIIVVEGATRSAEAIATPDGHSTDGTLAILRQFQQNEDPEKKVLIVTAEDEGYPNGFWPEKDEMSRAYARRASGDYLWQVDVDEFYLDSDIPHIIAILEQGVDAISFPTLFFWGGLDYTVDGYYFRAHGARQFHRIFAWGPGYTYKTHRPPTVLDEAGIDTRRKRWCTGKEMERRGIYLYHYSLLFPKQVEEKCIYRSQVHWTTQFRQIQKWAQESYFRLNHPFRMYFVTLNWLERFEGKHPSQVIEMMTQINAGVYPDIILRPKDDIESLLASPAYRIGCLLLKLGMPFEYMRVQLLQKGMQLLKLSPFYTPLRNYWRARHGSR